MNLIKDAWIPIVRANGGKDVIAPWQIAEREDPVLEIAASRPDFQGAVYQFLIGLLQTCFAPEDRDEWADRWDDPPDAALLRTQLELLAESFELDNPDGQAFMQDYSLPEGEKKSIASLLIEAPGGKTIRDNLDHFVKRGSVRRICKSCAAMALFTLQINAPSGGVGHRVGLRGGGPLTTLVLPPERTTLWQMLWLNVLDRDDMPRYQQNEVADVFPWMGPTRTSEKAGSDTTPDSVHPLQAYWGMPRRIRLLFPDEAVTGDCDLCPSRDVELVDEYVTRNYGINYSGAWAHPLTPYRFDATKEKPPISFKGQQGGLGYRHWLILTLADDENGDCAAKIVRRYTEQRARDLHVQRVARLWCFGFDMDNMKARCWYDTTFPLFNLDRQQRRHLLQWTGELIAVANDVSGILRKQVKAALFKRPEDAKGDMNTVVMDFWQQSEPVFYKILEELAGLAGDREEPPPELYSSWRYTVLRISEKLFDDWVLAAPIEDMNMKRIVAERDALLRLINGCKSMKKIMAKALPEKEGVNGTKTDVSLS